MENGQVTKTPHKFQKGVSGNPAGRPKGSKNRITLMKIALEGDLRTRLGKSAHEILERAIEMAKAGDPAMIKLLVDKMIPTSRSVDEEPSKERVQIVINRLGKEELPAINGQILEEVKDEQ
jgi:hypothetical protein